MRPKADYHTVEAFSTFTVMRLTQGSIAHDFDKMFIPYTNGAITERVSYIVAIENMLIQSFPNFYQGTLWVNREFYTPLITPLYQRILEGITSR